MNTRLKTIKLGLLPIVALGLFLAPSEAEAQRVRASGQAAVTDVSGTIITSGDMISGMLVGQPGTVQTFFCSEATGVRNAGQLLAAELELGRMWVMARNPGVRIASLTMGADGAGFEERQLLLSSALQEDLLVLLTAGDDNRLAVEGVVAGLTPPSNGSPGALRAARELVGLLDGLLVATAAMDVYHPGHEVATLLTRTVSRHNAFINASSEEFLRDPTEEFLAVETILSRLVVSAMDYSGDEEACGRPLPAPPEPAAPPAPPPVPERAMSICLMTDGDLQDVSAIFLPLTGETLVVVDGQRKPVSEAYPEDPALAIGAELVALDAPIEFRDREYLRFGLPRRMDADGLSRGGEFQGIGIFHEKGADSPPEVIYVPVAEGCLAQPYQRQELVRQVQG